MRRRRAPPKRQRPVPRRRSVVGSGTTEGGGVSSLSLSPSPSSPFPPSLSVEFSKSPSFPPLHWSEEVWWFVLSHCTLGLSCPLSLTPPQDSGPFDSCPVSCVVVFSLSNFVSFTLTLLKESPSARATPVAARTRRVVGGRMVANFWFRFTGLSYPFLRLAHRRSGFSWKKPYRATGAVNREH